MSLTIGRTYRMNRLYFKYLFDTPWEQDLTTERLAEMLQALGLIRVHGDRYEELPPFGRYCYRHNFLSNFDKLKTRYESLKENV